MPACPAPLPTVSAAQQWRTALLAVMDRPWEIMTLRGQVSTLRGRISTEQAAISSLGARRDDAEQALEAVR